MFKFSRTGEFWKMPLPESFGEACDQINQMNSRIRHVEYFDDLGTQKSRRINLSEATSEAEASNVHRMIWIVSNVGRRMMEALAHDTTSPDQIIRAVRWSRKQFHHNGYPSSCIMTWFDSAGKFLPIPKPEAERFEITHHISTLIMQQEITCEDSPLYFANIILGHFSHFRHAQRDPKTSPEYLQYALFQLAEAWGAAQARLAIQSAAKRGNDVYQGATTAGKASAEKHSVHRNEVLSEIERLIREGRSPSDAFRFAAKNGYGTSATANRALYYRSKK